MTRTELTAKLRAAGIRFEIISAPGNPRHPGPASGTCVLVRNGDIAKGKQTALITKLNRTLDWPVADQTDKGDCVYMVEG